MREGETLKAYLNRYWEMYNEMDDNFDDVAISTFKSGIPTEHGLRKSLIGKPVTSVRQPMDQIDKYRRMEEDQLQVKGKEKVIPKKGRDFRSDRYNNNSPRSRGGARNFGLEGPRLNYLVVSHNSRKTQNAMYMFLCIGLINVILIST